VVFLYGVPLHLLINNAGNHGDAVDARCSRIGVPVYAVHVLKVGVPVNMNYVESTGPDTAGKSRPQESRGDYSSSSVSLDTKIPPRPLPKLVPVGLIAPVSRLGVPTKPAVSEAQLAVHIQRWRWICGRCRTWRRHSQSQQ
jgi:hypothetical protein